MTQLTWSPVCFRQSGTFLAAAGEIWLEMSHCVSPVIDRTYAVASYNAALPAAERYLPLIRWSFFACRAKNDQQKEDKVPLRKLYVEHRVTHVIDTNLAGRR
jgi:hypothetical protein